VADMILFQGAMPAPEAVELSIAPPPSLTVGDQAALVVKTASGEVVPNTEVLWSATGDAWIDQGGMLHLLGAGSVTVRAMAKGRLLVVTIAIEAKPVPPAGG
jgi:hypothetical protein